MIDVVDMREKLGRATQTSDMGEREGADEVDNDRVGAIGVAARETPLGAAIVRWIAAMQDSAFVSVVEQLILSIEHRFGRSGADATLRIALQACREFSNWGCVECSGRGELVSGTGIHFPCPVCTGTKVRRYRDQDRADAMGASLADFRARYEKRLAWALDELHRHDHEVRRKSRDQLARY